MDYWMDNVIYIQQRIIRKHVEGYGITQLWTSFYTVDIIR